MKRYLWTLFLLCLFSSASRADLIEFEFSSEELSGSMASYTTNEWHIDTNDGWVSAELLVELDSGSIYQDANGSNNPPDPSLFTQYPDLEYDSYVTGGLDTDSSTSTTGTTPTIIGGAIDIGGSASTTLNTSAIDVTWCGSTTFPTGQLMLARITLSDDAQGMGTFLLKTSDSSGSLYSPWFMTVPIIDGTFALVPEPSLLSLVICLSGMMLCIRRRQFGL